MPRLQPIHISWWNKKCVGSYFRQMAAETNMATETSLVTQCLELTKLLTNSGKDFRINVKTGTFLYSVSLGSPRGDEKTIKLKKKKWSPATIRRSKKWREEFLAKKRLEKPAQLITSLPSNWDTFDQVGNIPQYDANATMEEIHEKG